MHGFEDFRLVFISNFQLILNKLFIHITNLSGTTHMTMLRKGCGKITRQLGNIENNTIFFLIFFLNLICHYGSWLRDFYVAQKRPKNTRKITVYKAGMTWRFGGISNCHTSRGIYGRNILST